MSEATPEDRETIKRCIEEGRVEFAGDIALFSAPDGPAEVSSVECWGKNKRNDGGFVVNWIKPGCGFGQLTFYLRDGKLRCQNETMGPQFCKEVMSALIDFTELEDQR